MTQAAGALLIFLAVGLGILRGALLDDQVLSAATQLARTGPFPGAASSRIPEDIPSLSDSAVQFVPWLRFAADAFAVDGKIPLWKDTAGTGAPFVGNGQSAVWFPTNLLAILVGAPPAALALQALAKLVAGAFGAWLLARHLGLSFAASILCGLVFGFGGFQVGWFLHPHTNVSLLLPFLVLAADRLVLRPSVPRVTLLAVVAGLQHLGGHPETSFHAQVVVALLGCARIFSLRASHRLDALWRRCAWLVAGLLLGLGLGAIQLAPLLEYMRHSSMLAIRAEEAPPAAMVAPLASLGFVAALIVALLALRRLARHPGTALWPALVLGCSTLVGVLLGLEAGMRPTFVLTVAPDWFGTAQDYVGPGARIEGAGAFAGAALPLAVLGIWKGRARPAARAAAALLAAGLLVGFVAPVASDVVQALPIFRLAVNTRLLLIALLGTAVLAGMGLDEVGRGLRDRRERVRLALLMLVPLVASFAALAWAVRSGAVTSDNGPRRPENASLTVAGLLPAAQVAPLVPGPAAAQDEEQRTFSGYVVSKARPASIRLLHGRLGDSVVARWAAAPAPAESTWVFQASVPESALLPERTIVRVVVADDGGKLTASGWLTSPDDPEPLLAFPARPAPGGTPLHLALLFSVLLLVVLPPPGGRGPALQRAVLVLLVGASLVSFAAGMVPLLPSDLFYPPSPVIDALREVRPQGRSLCMVPSILGPELPTWYGLADARSYDALGPAHSTTLAATALGRLPRVSPDDPTTIAPAAIPPDLALLGVMSVKVLVHVGLPPSSFKEVIIPRADDVAPDYHVVENPAWLPRARLVGGVTIEPDDDRAIELLRRPDFARERCIVLADGLAASAPSEGIGSADIVHSRPDSVVVQIQPDAPGWLVLADTYFPGWQASVDGTPRPIVRANVALRAVAVRPGDRVVEFRYEPASARLGAWASLATAVSLLAACLLAVRAA